MKTKYFLYARKSTEDEERQVMSIEAQLAELADFAKRENIEIAEQFIESKSAKKPGREIFNKMIQKIYASKEAVGILAWHPDRLARNSVDGGQIIYLIDIDKIVSLRFPTFWFEPTPQGLFMLQVAFGQSKYYSDNLSENVKHGIRQKLRRGEWPGLAPFGYVNNPKTRTIEPDQMKARVIKKAFEEYAQGHHTLESLGQGTSLEIITNDLNTSGYSKKVKSKNKLIRMDMRILSKIFHDPFYYGLLIQGGETVDLRMAYKFTPMITEDEFNQVQRLKYFKPMSKQHRLVFYPLRRLVACHLCNRPCVVAPSTSRSKIKYLYYRCDNFLCKRKKKSIRAKIVFDFISDFLADGLNFTEYEYSDYLKNMTVLTSKKKQSLVTELFSLRGALKKVKSEIDDISLKVVNYDNKSRIYQANYNKIVELSNEEQSLKERVEKLEEQLNKPQLDKLTVEQFLNLSKNASNIVKSADAIGKDQIVREIFLNLEVDEDKVAEYRLKEPFATLIKQRQLQLSRNY